jgi:hypothetical protein
MKPLKALLWMLVFLPTFFLNSCEKLFEAEQEGILKLALMVDQQSDLKAVLNDSTTFQSHYLIVSVVNENGEIVMNDKRLELYNFGGQWITEEIRLKVGAYELTKFLVVDPNGNVLYAAPIEGSPKAYLVNDPLPIQFGIIKDQVTNIVPEVLAVLGEPPEEFGYVTFSYSVVEPLDFYIGVYINYPYARPTIEFTDAKLTVRVDSLWWHSFKLEPQVNKVTIRDGYRCYVLIIEKEGYNTVKLKLSREELANTSPEAPLLVGLTSDYIHVLILQPGPEEGKDAMINRTSPDKNFGDHIYFEAINNQPLISTDIDCPLLTRSLIQWDLNQLPKSATIQKAIMTLYYPNIWIEPVETDTIRNIYYGWVDSTEIPDRYPLAVLQRIISPWEEYEVTWTNQPETTEEGQVFLPMKYYIMEANCVNCFAPPVSEEIDVTSLLTNTSGTARYGMLFKLVYEEYPQWFRFTSSDFKEPKLWPKLEIYYTLPE